MKDARFWVIVLAPWLVGCGAGIVKRKVGDVSYAFTPSQALQRVFVDSTAGGVQLLPSPDAQVHVSAEVWLDAGRAESEFTPQITRYLAVEDQNGTLSIRDRLPDPEAWELRIVVLVPAGLDYTLELDAGSLAINLPTVQSAKLKLGAGQASFFARAVTGRLDVELSTGQIEATVNEQGPALGLRAETGVGPIKLALPAQFAGHIDAKVSAGDIQIAPRLGVAVKRDYAAASANGVVGAGGPQVSLRASTGQITVQSCTDAGTHRRPLDSRDLTVEVPHDALRASLEFSADGLRATCRGRTRGSDLRIPIHRPVWVELSSPVLVTFEFPALGVRREVAPGRSVGVWYEAFDLGRHVIRVMQDGVSRDVGSVTVLSPEDFERDS